ncbi:MAG TPA: hypothetical protein VFP34_09225 [Microlunatus sp.]|nr:hypothetical protein [Microlunatus sp.]
MSRFRRSARGVALLVPLLLVSPALVCLVVTPSMALQPSAALRSDLNNDGFDDLVVGVPSADISGARDAGSVLVYLGGNPGMTLAATLTQNTSGLQEKAEAGDRFGAAIAVGHFNADDFADVAIGVPDEDLGTTRDAGAVHILYGSASGITTAGSQLVSQASAGVAGSPNAGDQFGATLAAGDLGRSAQADLAVGVPMEDVGSRSDAGVVQVLFGSPAGISTGGSQTISQNSPGIAGSAERGDHFGAVLAIGDVGRGAPADLAVGVPDEDLSGARDAGLAQIVYGSGAGLRTSGNTVLSQADDGIQGAPEDGDRFGSSLSAGDFDGSGTADLAIGIPGEDLAVAAEAALRIDAGAVTVVYGSTGRLHAADSLFLSQEAPGVSGGSESGDRFGATLAGGDVIGTAEEDLAIGVPGEDFSLHVPNPPLLEDAGMVVVIKGSPTRTVDSVQLTAETPEVLGQSETGDRWGAGIAVGNFTTSPWDTGDPAKEDVAIGSDGEDITYASTGQRIDDVGEVDILGGSERNLFAKRISACHLIRSASSVHPADHFGAVLGTGS